MQTNPRQSSRRTCFAVLLVSLALSACTSQSRKTSSNLDMNHPRYASRECQMALGRAQLHDNIKQSRVIASPVAVLLSGGTLFCPCWRSTPAWTRWTTWRLRTFRFIAADPKPPTTRSPRRC